MNAYLNIDVSKYININKYIYIYIHTVICIYIYTYAYIYADACKHTCVYSVSKIQWIPRLSTKPGSKFSHSCEPNASWCHSQEGSGAVEGELQRLRCGLEESQQ